MFGDAEDGVGLNQAETGNYSRADEKTDLPAYIFPLPSLCVSYVGKGCFAALDHHFFCARRVCSVMWLRWIGRNICRSGKISGIALYYFVYYQLFYSLLCDREKRARGAGFSFMLNRYPALSGVPRIFARRYRMRVPDEGYIFD